MVCAGLQKRTDKQGVCEVKKIVKNYMNYIKEIGIFMIYFITLSVLFLHFTMTFFYIWWKLGLGNHFIVACYEVMAMITSAFIASVFIRKGFIR